METIVLIGPIGVGKTTQAKLLEKELGLPRCSYDEVKGRYWKKLGVSEEAASAISNEHGEYAMISYMNEFKAKTIELIIKDHPGHIIDFGGGAQTFDEPRQINTVLKSLEQISNVFLLMPSADLATSIKSLPGIKENYPINAYLIMHPTNELFAKTTIYTKDNTPEETMHKIISHINKT